MCIFMQFLAVYILHALCSNAGCVPAQECANEYDADYNDYSSVHRCRSGDWRITNYYSNRDCNPEDNSVHLECYYGNCYFYYPSDNYTHRKCDDEGFKCESYLKYTLYFDSCDSDTVNISWKEGILPLGCFLHDTKGQPAVAYDTTCTDDSFHSTYYKYGCNSADEQEYDFSEGCNDDMDMYVKIQHCAGHFYDTGTALTVILILQIISQY
eukprot:112933_1